MTTKRDGIPLVFIVDDEAAVRDALRLVVQTMGISPKCFASGEEFLTFVESFQAAGPVCLIADLQMPQMSGTELLKQLKAQGREFPAIMITGHGAEALKNQAMSLGAAFLEKPFRPALLQESIKQALASHDLGQNTV